MPVNLPTNLLRSFVAIVDMGSMLSASEKVFVTQSALSLQIKRLEELVQQMLFDRDGRRLSLTAAGEVLLDYARRMLVLNDEAVVAVSAGHFSGTARIGMVQDFAENLLSGLLARFAELHPDAQIFARVAGTAPRPLHTTHRSIWRGGWLRSILSVAAAPAGMWSPAVTPARRGITARTSILITTRGMAVRMNTWRSHAASGDPMRMARWCGTAKAAILDPTKLHPLNHKGRFFSVVGPLNIQRSPQGEPVIFQAGDSEQGRDLGATIADGIFTHASTIEQGQAFYRDIKGRAEHLGRNPDEIVIMPGFHVTVGDTDEDAQAIAERYHRQDHTFERALGELGRSFGWHDFTRYDLDAPFPTEVLEHARNSFFTQAKRIADNASANGLTLRQVVETTRQRQKSPFTGSAETVADAIQRWFEGRAFDGLSVHAGHPAQFRRFTQEVVPILQDRGIVRKEYEATTLRGNLGLPIPTNVRTASDTGAEERVLERVAR